MLISSNLHKKSSEVSIKTRSTPASLSFKGQASKDATVKWSISSLCLFYGEGQNFCFCFSSFEESKPIENWDHMITF